MKAILLSLLATAATYAADIPQPSASERILILGDSITHGAGYVVQIESALITARPDQRITLISCGLSSETVSGLSEEGHAGGDFPRPTVHERLDRVLAKVKPTLVLACYGMNCGIYRPLAEDRFKAFREGMTLLHQKVEAAGAKIIHLTPAPFDPQPISAKVNSDRSSAAQDHSKPYAGYDEVLTAYSQWLLQQQQEQGWHVLDIHALMLSKLTEGRVKDPSYCLSKDGVHPGEEGHALMAAPVIQAWHLDTAQPPAELVKKITQKVHILRDAWLTETGHKRPGVRPGLPLAEAEAQAQQLDAEARALLTK
jgi:lysophospholipase L1-like esterase